MINVPQFIYSVIRGNDESLRPRMALDGIGKVVSGGPSLRTASIQEVQEAKPLPTPIPDPAVELEKMNPTAKAQ